MQEYPKLLWRPDGREVTAASKTEEDAYRADGCALVPPGQDAPKADTKAQAASEPAAELAAVEPALDEADVAAHGGRKKK